MGEIVTTAIICVGITLFGLALGFVFLQVQANTYIRGRKTKTSTSKNLFLLGSFLMFIREPKKVFWHF